MSGQHELRINPAIKKLLDAGIDDEIVELRGYVGRVDEEKIRLYKNLRLIDYLDIPADAVLHSSYEEDGSEEVSLFVRASVDIQAGSTVRTVLKARAASAISFPIESLCSFLDDQITTYNILLVDAVLAGDVKRRAELQEQIDKLEIVKRVWCEKGVFDAGTP